MSTPRSFNHYFLPVHDVPVYHQEEQLDRVGIPVTGEFEIRVTEEICSRLHGGDLFLKPLTEIVSRGTVHHLVIVAIVLADAI